VANLLDAVQRGLVTPLTQHGFTASGGGGERGETVECTNGTTLLTISADWLEGELLVTVRKPGGPSVDIGEVIDVRRIKGLHLSRLGRGVSTEQVAGQLNKLAQALLEQAPHVLTPSG
jgi:hypothetical protein